MEKLIELLNEYENYLDTTNRDDIQVHFKHINWADVKYFNNYSLIKYFHNYSLIISKRYLFIKWLVDNDKINSNTTDYEIFYYDRSDDGNIKQIDRYKELLMLLAISDTPIDLLCSVLK